MQLSFTWQYTAPLVQEMDASVIHLGILQLLLTGSCMVQCASGFVGILKKIFSLSVDDAFDEGGSGGGGSTSEDELGDNWNPSCEYSVCLSVCPSVCLSVCLPVCLFNFFFICLYIHLFPSFTECVCVDTCWWQHT